jgi:hypothetical protein
MNIGGVEINNLYVLFVVIFVIFFIIYKYTTETSPIIKQLNEYTRNKIDNIMANINDRPIYGILPPEYTETEYAGTASTKGNIINEQIVEQKCPVGSYLDQIEIGTNNGFVNYIKGKCKNGKELNILGMKFDKSKIKNIKKLHGIDALGIEYDASYLNNVYQIGESGYNGKTLQCPRDNIIVGYRGRAENPNYDEVDKNSDFRVKHLQFVCNHKDAQKKIPITHSKCGDEGEICEFNRNHEYIYYGVPGKKVVKINKKDIDKDSFTCRHSGFFGKKQSPVLPIDDPLPGAEKSCYLERSDYNFDYEGLLNTIQHRLWGAGNNDSVYESPNTESSKKSKSAKISKILEK